MGNNNNINNNLPNKKGSRFGSRFSEKSANQFFGQRLKIRRELFGYSQVELAKKIGANKSTIQNYEGGKLPKGDYLILLAKELRCSVGWLLTGESPEPDPPEMDPVYKVEQQDNLNFAAQESQYDLHGGWKPRHVGEHYVYAGKVLEILSQNSAYSRALKANIDSFYAAIQAEKKLFETYKTLQNQSKLIQQLEDRIATLEKKTAAGE